MVLPPVSWTEPAPNAHRPALGRPATSLPAAAAPDWCSPATAAGRHLLVVIADAPDGGVGIVTARAMTDTEKRTFRRKDS